MNDLTAWRMYKDSPHERMMREMREDMKYEKRLRNP
jgi:hypothetical protein